MNRVPASCHISKSVNCQSKMTTKEYTQILNDVRITKTFNNLILQAINEKLEIDAKKGQKFQIIADSRRYGIEICMHNSNKTVLYQHYLFFNGEKTVSCHYRKVIIEWNYY